MTREECLNKIAERYCYICKKHNEDNYNIVFEIRLKTQPTYRRYLCSGCGNGELITGLSSPFEIVSIGFIHE